MLGNNLEFAVTLLEAAKQLNLNISSLCTMSLLKEPKFLEEEKDAPLLILHHDDVLTKV
jgi:post-segregation antitoxin (ccd killing protein)